MTSTKLKLGILGTIAVAAVAATLVLQHQSLARLQEENQQQHRETAQLAAENERLNERLSNLVAQAHQAVPEAEHRELLRLRSEVGTLRQQTRELARVQEENRQPQEQAQANAITNAPNPDEAQALQSMFDKTWQLAGARHPDANAQATLAEWYWTGKATSDGQVVVKQDQLRSYIWALVAASKGNTNAIRLVREEELSLSDTDKEKGRALADQYKAGLRWASARLGGGEVSDGPEYHFP